MHRQILLLAPLLCFVLMRQGDAADPSAAQVKMSAEELARLAEHRTLNAIKAAYAVTQSMEGSSPRDPNLKSELAVSESVKFLIDLTSDRFLIEDQSPPRADRKEVVANQQVVAWDLKTFVSYGSRAETARIFSKPPNARLARLEPFLYACLLYPPKPDGDGIEDGALISWIRDGSVHAEMEEVDGRRCCVVDRNRADGHPLARAWLDVERSLTPVKWQRLGNATEVVGEHHSKDFVEVSGDGRSIWLPMHVEIKIFRPKYVITRSISVDRDATSINPPISQSSFQPKFPVGTRIYDPVSNTRYVVGE
ncbi:MAG TPA: hypothetical protein VMF30_14140 [Pirellulales bacterium]|nr:hypothetical protein [Pirellulales bacterium]